MAIEQRCDDEAGNPLDRRRDHIDDRLEKMLAAARGDNRFAGVEVEHEVDALTRASFTPLVSLSSLIERAECKVMSVQPLPCCTFRRTACSRGTGTLCS